MTPTETLKHEHQIILLVLDAAEAQSRQGVEGQLDLAKAGQMADFFRNFADRCHHAKEEGYLFPLLVERGLPRDEGPIAVMLAEHEEGREHVRGMFAQLEQPRPDHTIIAEHLGEFVVLLRSHIGKEDNVLFPMADELLTPADQAALAAQFERVETEELGEGIHEQYHQLAHELTAH